MCYIFIVFIVMSKRKVHLQLYPRHTLISNNNFAIAPQTIGKTH